MECRYCGKEIALPFRCPYCQGYFCSEHRLPENHQCPDIIQARTLRRERDQVILQKQGPYEYRVTYTPHQPRRIHFSNREIKHLAIAALLVIGIGLSSAYSWSGFGGFALSMDYTTLAVLSIILLASFSMHEIAHKIAAQRRGLWAEFRIVFTGALLTLISIFLPFKIISPGAVMVSGSVDRESRGKISIAGPLINIIFAAIFLLLAIPFNSLPFILGAIFNSWIALFNLIPFGMLDGFKVLLWNRTVWASAFSASLILTIISLFIYG